MNTKNNKRRRESIERIEKTFIELLQTKELKDITVSDICKRCELNRSTFYANYADVYDLADKLKNNLEQQVFGLYEAENHLKFHSYNYLPLLQHMKKNQLFYRTYFKLGYDNQYSITLYDNLRALRDFDGKYIDYHLEFFKSGFNAVIKMWLAGGCKETPEEINHIIRSEYQGRGEN